MPIPEKITITKEFDYMKEMDPRKEDHYVVYPLVKLWHLLLFFAIALPLVWYFK
tara:strand:- start:197 stop:358 length:162 start_codon:yes stop_codon:yes gene_type:complete